MKASSNTVYFGHNTEITIFSYKDLININNKEYNIININTSNLSFYNYKKFLKTNLVIVFIDNMCKILKNRYYFDDNSNLKVGYIFPSSELGDVLEEYFNII